MNRPPLHSLQGFVAAARLGNLSRAAERLHLTVSALSHQIKGLEERLDQRLFARGARGIALTPDGQRLFDRVAPALDTIEHALRPYAAKRDQVLTISLMPSFAASWLMPRLGRFLAAQPQLEINLQSSSALVDFERDRSIDAALRFGPGQWAGLEAVHLFDDFITPTASPALLARLGRPTRATLHTFPLLGDPGGRWSEWFARFGGTPPKRYAATFTDSETLHRAAVEGLGIALGRVTLTRPMVETGLLVRLFEDDCLPAEFAHYLVFPPRSASHAGLVAFRHWLQQEARDYAAASASRAAAALTSASTRKRKGKSSA
ncbi:MAG: LysR substrate-binding domain-containing protein [Chiayiivirga sp.]|jgi:LysR family glycine cleavage system transcriptional activator|nr:LysR substrate-binding domain-containing protein [Chiayiivirga sp.]